MRTFSVEEITQIVGGMLTKEQDATITQIAPPLLSDENTLALALSEEEIANLANSKAKAALVPLGVNIAGLTTIEVERPRLAMMKLITLFYEEPPVITGNSNIHPTATIHETAKIGKDCFIGANVVIGNEVEIGDNCFIGANVVIEHNCKIGNNCRIGNNASIAYTVMGNSCYIYTGARLGYDGFGFEFINGQHHRIPQLGRLIIGDDVEIGANTCIDRGALDDTIIGTGSRIDNLVQIAHNDKLGRGCIIVSQVGIAGSCTLGDYVILGGQVGLADHLNIGTGAQIAAQSGVMRDVEAGAVVMGTPCVPFKDYMRQVSFLQKNSKK